MLYNDYPEINKTTTIKQNKKKKRLKVQILYDIHALDLCMQLLIITVCISVHSAYLPNMVTNWLQNLAWTLINIKMKSSNLVGLVTQFFCFPVYRWSLNWSAWVFLGLGKVIMVSKCYNFSWMKDFLVWSFVRHWLINITVEIK